MPEAINQGLIPHVKGQVFLWPGAKSWEEL
jgi:hypothetical protein